MKTLVNFLKKFFIEEEGQIMSDYALILVLIAVMWPSLLILYWSTKSGQ